MSEELTGYTCYWKIENFTLRNSKPDLYLRSPEFQADCLNSRWYITMQQIIPGYIGVFLFKKNNTVPTNLNVSVSLLKSSGWEIVAENQFEFKAGKSGYGAYELMSWQNIANEEWTYLPCGSLTVSLNMYNDDLIEKKPTQWLMISRMTSGAMNLKHLPVQKFRDLEPNDLLKFPVSYSFKKAKDFKTTEVGATNDRGDALQLFKKMDLSFVTLRTKYKEFYVLKTFLYAKSSVFKAMLERRPREGYSNSIDIDDIDSDTFSLLIEYLHHQPIFWDLKWDEAMKLYYAADKFKLEELKKTCLSLLRVGISLKTVCKAFELAELHQDKHLWQSAEEFFSKNSKAILKSAEWKVFLLNHTELASKILYKLADKL